MSFDLAFWHEEVSSTLGRAAEIYERLAEGETGVVQAPPSIDAFFSEVVTIFGDLNEETLDVSPWASLLYRNPECVIASMVYSRSEEVAPVLGELARKHELAMYDPQKQELLHSRGW